MGDISYQEVKGKFFPETPDDVRMTLRVTMPLKHWKYIKNILATDVYEEWPLRALIGDLILQAERGFSAEVEEKK